MSLLSGLPCLMDAILFICILHVMRTQVLGIETDPFNNTLWKSPMTEGSNES